MIGPTAHRVDNDDDLGTSLAGWNEIYTEARKLVPALQPADLITAFAGLRAVGTTGDFLIAPSHVSPRFINAAGIESPGLTAAPAIAEYIVELIKDSGLKLRRKREFNPIRSVVRLRDLNPREQAALMQKDPAYGQIICRCEMVSAGEIRDAIRRGATTGRSEAADQSGMGRCQGDLYPKIIRLLSDELGLPPERISKNGPGSELLFGRLREDQRRRQRRKNSMLSIRAVDLVVIGGGPAGMAAALAAAEAGVEEIVLLERQESLGGILPQCIHNGFGLRYFKEELTGPEYAHRFMLELEKHSGIKVKTATMVVQVTADRQVVTTSAAEGLVCYQARAVILAMGCRERPRGAINIPGTRRGLYGGAQYLMNIGFLPTDGV